MAGVGELFGQLVGDDVVGGDAPAIESFDSVLFGLREAQDVSVQL
jgi:hypothetical protein